MNIIYIYIYTRPRLKRTRRQFYRFFPVFRLFLNPLKETFGKIINRVKYKTLTRNIVCHRVPRMSEHVPLTQNMFTDK